MRADLLNGVAAAALLVAASAAPHAALAQTAADAQTSAESTAEQASDAARSAAEDAEEAADAAAEGVESAAEDAADGAEQAADDAAEAADDAVEAAKEAMTPPPATTEDGMPAADETAEAGAPPAEMIVTEQGIDDLMSYDVIGASVMNAEGERIGEIDSLVLGSDGIVAAVVGVGGFLGIGEKHVGIAWNQLMATEHGYSVSATADELVEAPTFMTQEDLVDQAEREDARAETESPEPTAPVTD